MGLTIRLSAEGATAATLCAMALRSPTVDSVMLEFRAAQFARRSIKAQSKLQGLLLALSMIDLTTLEGKDSPQKVRALCRKAITPYEFPIPHVTIPSVAAVCVYPALVGIAKQALAGSSVKVASVATGFPSGQYPLDVKLADVQRAVADGADEIDMVINRGAFLAGRYDEVAEEIRAVKVACGAAHVKIILETGELETYDNIRRAADLAIEAACTRSTRGQSASAAQIAESSQMHRGSIPDGEFFIKTSTGKVTPAATMPVTLVMLQAIRDHFVRTGVRIGMKPAGGIRTAKQALHYLVMVKETLGDEWLTPHLFRFGASALANDILRQIMKQTRDDYVASYEFSEA